MIQMTLTDQMTRNGSSSHQVTQTATATNTLMNLETEATVVETGFSTQNINQAEAQNLLHMFQKKEMDQEIGHTQLKTTEITDTT